MVRVRPLGTEEEKVGICIMEEGKAMTMSLWPCESGDSSISVNMERGSSYFPHSILSFQDWGGGRGESVGLG